MCLRLSVKDIHVKKKQFPSLKQSAEKSLKLCVCLSVYFCVCLFQHAGTQQNVVNLTNILRAAFAPIFFHQKKFKPKMSLQKRCA
jgi:hypothetical protein